MRVWEGLEEGPRGHRAGAGEGGGTGLPRGGGWWGGGPVTREISATHAGLGSHRGLEGREWCSGEPETESQGPDAPHPRPLWHTSAG